MNIEKLAKTGKSDDLSRAPSTGSTGSNGDMAENGESAGTKALLRNSEGYRERSLEDAVCFLPLAAFAIASQPQRTWVSFLGGSFLGWRSPNVHLMDQKLFSRASNSCNRILGMMRVCGIRMSDTLFNVPTDNGSTKGYNSLYKILETTNEIDRNMINALKKYRQHILHNAVLATTTIAEQAAVDINSAVDQEGKKKKIEDLQAHIKKNVETHIRYIKSLPFEECRSRGTEEFEGIRQTQDFVHTHLVSGEGKYMLDEMKKAAELEETIKLDNIISAMEATCGMFEKFRDALSIQDLADANQAFPKNHHDDLIHALEKKFKYVSRNMLMIGANRKNEQAEAILSSALVGHLVERLEDLWCHIYVFLQTVMGLDDEIEPLTNKLITAVAYGSMAHLFTAHPPSVDYQTLEEGDAKEPEKKILDAFSNFRNVYEISCKNFFANLEVIQPVKEHYLVEFQNNIRNAIKKNGVMNYDGRVDNVRFDPIFSKLSNDIQTMFAEKVTSIFGSINVGAVQPHGSYITARRTPARDFLIGEFNKMLTAQFNMDPNYQSTMQSQKIGVVVGFAVARAQVYNCPAFAALIGTRNFVEEITGTSGAINVTRSLINVAYWLYIKWRHPFGHLNQYHAEIIKLRQDLQNKYNEEAKAKGLGPKEISFQDAINAAVDLNKSLYDKQKGMIQGSLRPTWIKKYSALNIEASVDLSASASSILTDDSITYFKFDNAMIDDYDRNKKKMLADLQSNKQKNTPKQQADKAPNPPAKNGNQKNQPNSGKQTEKTNNSQTAKNSNKGKSSKEKPSKIDGAW